LRRITRFDFVLEKTKGTFSILFDTLFVQWGNFKVSGTNKTPSVPGTFVFTNRCDV
jgi:hypothetical protein